MDWLCLNFKTGLFVYKKDIKGRYLKSIAYKTHKHFSTKVVLN